MLELLSALFSLKTVLLGVTVCLVSLWLLRKRKYNLPPGTYPFPLFGNIFQFETDMIHEQFYKWSLKYGPVISVYYGPYLAVIVNDVETAMEVLVKKGSDFASRVKTPSTDAMTDGGKDIAYGQFGPTWRLHRKIASKALRNTSRFSNSMDPDNAQHFSLNLASAADKVYQLHILSRQYIMGDELENRIHATVTVVFDEIKKQSEPCDPINYITFIIGNILYGICYGGKLTYNNPELMETIRLEDDSFKLFSGIGFLEDIVPGLAYVWETKKMQRLKKNANTVMKNYLTKHFKQHLETFDKNNIRDFSDTLILTRQEAEEDPTETNLENLSQAHLIQTVSDIFFAGMFTSKLTLRWAILHMVKYPEIQSKVQEEIDQVVGFNELPNMSHRPQLQFTEAVLHESMRVASVLPVGLPHMTTCDTSIAGYDVPKNTPVVINQWALHNDQNAWSEVSDFQPSRFLDANGRLAPKPQSWLPFSVGKRVCLGETLSKQQLHLIFACLMQRFRWRMADGEKVDLTAIGNSFGLAPKPHKLIAEERRLRN